MISPQPNTNTKSHRVELKIEEWDRKWPQCEMIQNENEVNQQFFKRKEKTGGDLVLGFTLRKLSHRDLVREKSQRERKRRLKEALPQRGILGVRIVNQMAYKSETRGSRPIFRIWSKRKITKIPPIRSLISAFVWGAAVQQLDATSSRDLRLRRELPSEYSYFTTWFVF